MGTWEEWGKLTRFMESTRIALVREDQLWGALQLERPEGATIAVADGQRTYRVALDDHRKAVRDEHALCMAGLLASYALAEGAAAGKLGKDVTAIGGIEVWGAELIACSGSDWSSVVGDKGGVVEVAVTRNLLVHGESVYNQTALNRVGAAGLTPTWVAGESIVLEFGRVAEFRSRLKSLMRLGEIR